MANTERDVARSIRSALRIEPDEQVACSTRYEATRLWIDRAEAAGVFIFRRGQIELEEIRGFVICDEYAPFVYVNSEDGHAAQMFTLAHELAHLWLGVSGISNLEPTGKALSKKDEGIERFCNKVAAEAILDHDRFLAQWSRMDEDTPLQSRVEAASKNFKVSEEVVARRLLDLGEIPRETYLELRAYYNKRWREYKSEMRLKLRSADSAPSYYVTKVFNNGYSFTQMVISTYQGGGITGRSASELLDIKLNNIGRLAESAGIPAASRERGGE